MRLLQIVLVLALLCPLCVTASVCQQTGEGDSAYLVDKYDANRDPASDLEEAMRIGQSENKRILLMVGGDWCIDCLILDRFLERTAAVLEKLQDGFIVLKVNYSRENQNEAFLSNYPAIEWFPHIHVLASDGSLLHSKDTRELHAGRSLSETRIKLFLDEWAPDSVR